MKTFGTETGPAKTKAAGLLLLALYELGSHKNFNFALPLKVTNALECLN